MFFVNLIAFWFVAKWAIRQILAMLGGLILIVLCAVGGDPWPLIGFGAIFAVLWLLAKLVWHMLGWDKPVAPQSTLEALCAEERRIQEHAAGFDLGNGMRADARARW
jgi:hypothetical protein